MNAIKQLSVDKSTLVQVMAWCRQATSHYLSQSWLRYLSSYGVMRGQWVKHWTKNKYDKITFISCWFYNSQKTPNITSSQTSYEVSYMSIVEKTDYLLTNLPQDKMAGISQTLVSNAFSWMKSCFFIWISLKCISKGPIDNKTALVQIMAWCRTGDKPLPQPMLTQFTDAYMRH